jgi:hypothetical protein
VIVLVDPLHPAGWQWSVWDDNRRVAFGAERFWLVAQIRARSSAARYRAATKMEG